MHNWACVCKPGSGEMETWVKGFMMTMQTIRIVVFSLLKRYRNYTMTLWLSVWYVGGLIFFFENSFLITANWSSLQMEYLLAVLSQTDMVHAKFQCSYRQGIDSNNWCHPVFRKLFSLKITWPYLSFSHCIFSLHAITKKLQSNFDNKNPRQLSCQCNFLYLYPGTCDIRSRLSKPASSFYLCVSWCFRWGNGRTTRWALSTLSGQGTALLPTATLTITTWALSPWRRLPLSSLRMWTLWWKAAKKTLCHVVNLSELSK